MGVLMKNIAGAAQAERLPRSDERRPVASDQARRAARFELAQKVHGPGTRTLILNLSETGLLIKSDARLKLGDTVHVSLPNVGETAAEVVRVNGDEYGCRLYIPISSATVSATALAAQYDLPTPRPEGARRRDRARSRIERLPVVSDIAQREDNKVGGAISLIGLMALLALVVFTLTRIF